MISLGTSEQGSELLTTTNSNNNNAYCVFLWRRLLMQNNQDEYPRPACIPVYPHCVNNEISCVGVYPPLWLMRCSVAGLFERNNGPGTEGRSWDSKGNANREAGVWGDGKKRWD